jgi:hypothetical protein
MKTKKERSSTVKRPYGLLDFFPKGLQDPWSADGQDGVQRRILIPK